MDERNLDLLKDEEIVLEIGPAVLTNQRLVANYRIENGEEVRDEVLLKGVHSLRTVNGGFESRIKQGLTLGGIGIVMAFLEVVVSKVNDKVGVFVFLIGAMGVAFGLHLIIRSLVRSRPHTTVVFKVLDARDIMVSFRGRENPDAEALTRAFNRARRRL
ncbi:MAG: hypothetical protein QF467_07375 [SAR202 cluster bacterium]|jgi:hypothetical protein|nr:hypothetical protein [SAR202 cluster bacterium]